MTLTAVAIGNFDGVHIGHRALLRTVLDIARERGLRPAAMTFEPHPLQVVAPERAPRLLTTLGERVRLIRDAGIDEVMVLPFTPEFARYSPERFAGEILAGLGVQSVVVGESFRFGHKHAGDTAQLRRLGARFGFDVTTCAPVTSRGKVVSSSEIRALITTGDVSKACRMIGRWFAVEGPVVSGRGIGSKQTVPTLNLEPPIGVTPGDGVYATRATDVESGEAWDSVTNVGIRPTFGGESRTIETFVLGQLTATPTCLRVRFLKRLRDERKFESPDALRAQILHDVARARSLFKRLPDC